MGSVVDGGASVRRSGERRRSAAVCGGGGASTTWMAEVAIRDRRLQVRESAVEVTSWSPM